MTSHQINGDEMYAPDADALAKVFANTRQVGGNHYKNMPMQPWDVMEAVLSAEEFAGFLKGNVIKYSMRAGLKGSAVEDGEKAKHYCQKLREVLNRRMAK